MGRCKIACRQSFEERFSKAIETLDLTQTEKSVIQDRFVRIVISAESDYNRTTGLFILLTNLITVGGVLLISFLTLEKVNGISASVSQVFFWISWVLSIVVTVANKSLYSFNLPKKYMLNVLTLEKYKSEGWQFVGGVGKYQSCGDIHNRTQLFCSRIERIKMKSLELLAHVESSSIDKVSNKPALGEQSNLSHSIELRGDNIADILDTGRVIKNNQLPV